MGHINCDNPAVKLICEIFVTFSRMEFALKETGYASGGGNRVSVNWCKFAEENSEFFNSRLGSDEKFKSAVEYLRSKPPKKQVLEEGTLGFIEQDGNNNQTEAQKTIRMVRRVRNNLFHGGKYLIGGEKDRERDRKLVRHSLIILKHCATLDRDVNDVMSRIDWLSSLTV